MDDRVMLGFCLLMAPLWLITIIDSLAKLFF